MSGTAADRKRLIRITAGNLRNNTINTIMGPVKFGKNGEWADSGMMQVQYKNIKGNDMEQFRGMDVQTIVAPAKHATGEAIVPFEKARQ